MISQSNLPEALIALCLDVLTKISDGERDLIRVVVDVITELREGDGDEDVSLSILTWIIAEHTAHEQSSIRLGHPCTLEAEC